MGERVVGCVKWFNAKSGYGFLEGDVFVHYTALVAASPFKYLVPGEIVEYAPSDTPRVTARSVTGMNRGQLMCDKHL